MKTTAVPGISPIPVGRTKIWISDKHQCTNYGWKGGFLTCAHGFSHLPVHGRNARRSEPVGSNAPSCPTSSGERR